MTTANKIVAYTIMAAFVLATTIGTTSAFAYHNINFEDHIWTRTAGDGHTSFLNCVSDNCDLKIKSTSGIQGYSQSAFNSEIDNAETHFDGLGEKMSIDRVTTADSIIHQGNLDNEENGRTVFDNHCTAYHSWWWWVCVTWDIHYIKMDVKLNDNANDVKFKLAENENANPPEFDIRKTAGHELWHAMGVDHNTTDTASIVYYVYVFGANNGYEATTDDADELGDIYP